MNVNLKAAVDFICSVQNQAGEIASVLTYKQGSIRRHAYQHCVFPALHVGYSLSFLRSDVVESILEKIRNFVLAERTDQRVWRFFSKNSSDNLRLGADVDTTSCAALVLRDVFKLDVSDLESLVLSQIGPAGQVETWFPEPGSKINDFDLVVNANALSIIGRSELSLALVKALEQSLIRGVSDNDWPYYCNQSAFVYAMSRALYVNPKVPRFLIQYLMPLSIETLRSAIKSQNPDHIAFSVCGLLNLGLREHPMLNEAMLALAKLQMADGRWPVSLLWQGPAGRPNAFWSSEGVTAAVCIEAVSRFFSLDRI